MDTEQLYVMLIKSQEPKGYFSNKNRATVFELFEGLLINKKRYGYTGCPCRLLSGDPDDDKDIICPCIHREPEFEEYGSCYCNLFVSKDWNNGVIPSQYVPERRPPEKFKF